MGNISNVLVLGQIFSNAACKIALICQMYNIIKWFILVSVLFVYFYMERLFMLPSQLG